MALKTRAKYTFDAERREPLICWSQPAALAACCGETPRQRYSVPGSRFFVTYVEPSGLASTTPARVRGATPQSHSTTWLASVAPPVDLSVISPVHDGFALRWTHSRHGKS